MRLHRVTIVRDRVTRRSKGVAFVLFSLQESAQQAVEQLNGTVLQVVYSVSDADAGIVCLNETQGCCVPSKLFQGRTIKCSIARDNNRASEFIKKRGVAPKHSIRTQEFGICVYTI